MLVSGNDAAVALAEFIAGDINNFCDIMNMKAKELGLTSTHFKTPHGLDNDEHYTTAFELSLIANYALTNNIFCKIVNTAEYTINISGKIKSIHNTNELLGSFPGVYGIKTGFTNGANRCLVTCCKRGDLDIICVVLGCDTKKDRTLDSIKLINYIFNNYSVVNIKDIINQNFSNWLKENSKIFNINKGYSQELNLYLNENQIPYSNIALNNDFSDKILTPITVIKNYEAPLNENTVVGTMYINIEDKTYFSVDILNKNTIKRKNTLYYIFILMKNYFNYL